jgi:hypothetical protein
MSFIVLKPALAKASYSISVALVFTRSLLGTPHGEHLFILPFLKKSCSSKEYIRPEKWDQAERFIEHEGMYNMIARENLGYYNPTFKRHQGDILLFSLTYIQTNRGD